MLRYLGAGLVIWGSVAIGAAMTGEMKSRVMQLQELRKLVVVLKGEIRYGNATLNEAFRHVALRIRPPYRELLACAAERMEEFRGEGLSEIFSGAVKEKLKDSALHREDLQLLERLGDSLGYPDVETQMNSLELFSEQINGLCTQAEKELGSKAKIYHYLGLTGGLFLAIILI